MKKQAMFSDKKRTNLLRELEESPKKFVELKKLLNLQSNLLSYNLRILLKENLVKKQGLNYLLTNKAKYLMPYVRKFNDASSLPLPCVATIVKKNGNILIRKKAREPEKGKSIFIGGKIERGESIFDACKRHVKEKVGIEIKNLRIICINNYISKNKEVTSHFVVFFVICEPLGNPKNAIWKDPNKMGGEMFPDNKFIIKNMLNNKRVRIINSIYDEEKDSFKVVNIN